VPAPSSTVLSGPTHRPEYEAVRLASRAVLPAARAAALRDCVSEEGFDWDTAVQMAVAHRVLPLFHTQVAAHAREAVPERLRTMLANTSRANVMHVLMLSAEMAAIGERLDAEGIPLLVLKGPTLSSAYGGVALRPFVDNDLLIRRADFERADALLLEMGFQRKERGALQRAGYLLVHGEYTFGRLVGNLISTVDVHTDILPLGYSYNESFEALLSRSREVQVAGRTVQGLAWPDLLLALCVNALKDQWMSLRLATDIAEVAACIDDWDEVAERAARMRSLRVLHLALLLAHDVAGADLPAAVLQRARADAGAVALATWVGSRFAAHTITDALTGRERVRLNMKVQDGLIGRIRYIGYAALRRLTESFVDPAD
jgi:hypothetical protein